MSAPNTIWQIFVVGFFSVVCVAVVHGPAFAQQTTVSDSEPSTDQRPIVIVHGAWGGAHHWKAVADALTHEHDREVHRVSLTGQGERVHLAGPQVTLKTHIQDVVNVIDYDDLHSVVLIGHSYGGGIISGVADAIPDRLSQLIYLDASLLENGETFFSQNPEGLEKAIASANAGGDGWRIPVPGPNPQRDVPHPLATLTHPIELTNPAREKIPAVYWLFADGGPLEKDSRLFYFERAQQRGWPVKTFSWDHNPQRSKPDELVAALVELFEDTDDATHSP